MLNPQLSVYDCTLHMPSWNHIDMLYIYIYFNDTVPLSSQENSTPLTFIINTFHTIFNHAVSSASV